MKLNWFERLVVNNPMRVMEQRVQMFWFQKVLPPVSQMRILEVGCGRGAGSGLIEAGFEPSRLYALDLDIRMVRQARTYLEAKDHDRLLLSVGNAAALPFESGSLDALFGFGFLHHVPDWRRALAEVARVLKGGGVYYLEELFPTFYQNFITKHLLLHPEKDRFNSRDLKEALSENAFTLEGVLEIKWVGLLAVAVKRKGLP